MNRSLGAQMRHEWRSNVWMVVELMIVFTVVWFIMMLVTGTVRTLLEPKGFDETDVYTVNISYIGSDSPEYVDMGEATEENNFRDQMELIRRVRSNSNVEAAAFSNNAVPFYFSYWGNSFRVTGTPDSVGYNGNWREASPEIARVLRLESTTGQSVEELERRMRRGEVLVSPYGNMEATGLTEEMLRGAQLTKDSVTYYKVGDLVNNMKRSEYENNSWGGMFLKPIDETAQSGNRFESIIMRMKPGMGMKFAEDLRNDPSLRQQRNVVLSNFSSLEARRDVAQRNKASELRAQIGVMALFLVTVFLGLLGSFWYRVQQRQGEIAMRKVCGADRWMVFRRLMGEGSLLLLAGGVPALALGAVLLFWKPGMEYFESDWTSVGVGCGVTAVVMELMIIAGVYFPARRAMAVEPAEALKDE